MAIKIGTMKAAQILGVSQSTVQRMAAAGDLGPVERVEGGRGGYMLLQKVRVERAAAKRAKDAKAEAAS